MSDITFFHVLRAIAYWTSPVVFFVGVLLVLYGIIRRSNRPLVKRSGHKKEDCPGFRE